MNWEYSWTADKWKSVTAHLQCQRSPTLSRLVGRKMFADLRDLRLETVDKNLMGSFFTDSIKSLLHRSSIVG